MKATIVRDSTGTLSVWFRKFPNDARDDGDRIIKSFKLHEHSVALIRALETLDKLLDSEIMNALHFLVDDVANGVFK